ncbi:MAG: hypothetical protein FJ096_19350, partial [Deltaproteobacteria bacterium]|nr:hypothetical protein [Deltaproteobacteria bacterium]
GYPPPPAGYPPGAAPPTARAGAPPFVAVPSAGGLSAPPPLASPTPPPTPTQTAIEESRDDDSGRGLTWIWLDAEGGFQHVGLETFDVDKSNLTAGLVPTEASGAFVGAGFGVQLLFLRLGPRARMGFFDNWNMISVGGEVGLRIPLGFLEPHLDLGGGYVALGNLSTGGLAAIADKASVSGGYGRVAGGLDIFLGKIVSIGPYASWEFMGLKRPGVSLSDLDPTKVSSLSDAQKTAAALDGAGYGSTVTVGARLGLNF